VSAAADALVYDALMAKVGEFTYNPVIPVSWPDVAFNPGGHPYIAPMVMPAETTQYSVQNAGTRVPRPPTITGAVDEAGWRHVPVTVPYEAFV
jgi:hypothetical protein